MSQNKFKNWVNAEVGKQLDKVRFFQLPLKMRIGILLMGFSYTVGYGVSILVLIISGLKHKLTLGLIRGSIFYIVSWPIGFIGLTLAGPDCIKYPIYFFAKFLKKIFSKYFEG